MEIVQVNDHLVGFAVGKFLEHLLVFVPGLLPPFPLGTTGHLGLVILVHKVILVAEIILVNVDVAKSIRDSLLGGRLEVGKKVAEGG